MGPSFTNWHICIAVIWGRQTLDGGQIGKIYLTTFVSLRLSLSVI